MDYNKFFIEGQKVSSFVKNTNKIWEGTIIVKSDGTKVVLNESSNTWKKLSDLTHIKRTGHLLYEEDVSAYTQFVKNELNELNPENLQDEKSVDKITDAIYNKAEKAGVEDADKENTKAVLEVENFYDQIGEPSPTDEGEEIDFDEVKKSEEELEKFTESKIKETLMRLHPSLRERLFQEDELRELGAKAMQDAKDAQEEEEYGPPEDDHEEKEAEDYEDNDYLDVPADLKNEIIEKVLELFDGNVNEIEEEIKSKYELSDEDAEEFVYAAMEKYVTENEVEVKDSIKDEIESDFEDVIDKFEGPNDELLDHLVDEFEIDPDEAESVWHEKKGNLTECVFAFVDIVRKRIRDEK